MKEYPRTVFTFGRFRLDLGRGLLFAFTGAELNLRPKSFDVLRHLVENPDRIVSRDELLDAVWPGVFVTDDSVTQCVTEVRRALGDAGQQLLRTVPKRGYVLAAEVARIELPSRTDDAATPLDEPPPAGPASVGSGVAERERSTGGSAQGVGAAFAPGVSVGSGSVRRNFVHEVAGAASSYAGKIQAFLEAYLMTERERAAVPFGGRDKELAELDDWLGDGGAEPRFLLTAPAGRGKSALLVQWMRRLDAESRLGGGEDGWQLAFVPVSMRFGTHRPEVYYEALAARLAELLAVDLPPTQTDPATYYEDRCRRLLNEALAQDARLLIVIDGLDEALGGCFDAGWFPRGPGPGIRLLVSARVQVGDRDARGWVERLGWEMGVRVRTRNLPALRHEGVRELLLKMGGPLEALASRPGMVARLHRLTEGEPLLLRLYVEDLWERGGTDRFAAEELEAIKPGFGGYFAAWLARQREAWEMEREKGARIDETVLEAYLAVLACAHGPLAAEELGALTRRLHDVPPTFRIENVLSPLRRFVIGTDRRSRDVSAGYVLSHPKFGEFLREDYFDAHRVEQARQAFAAWGRDVLRRLSEGGLAPENTPSYLLQFLGQHLNDADAPASELMRLVEGSWLRAWEAFEGGHRGFSEDVRRAERGVANRTTDAATAPAASRQPLWAWRLRCQLVLSSVASIGSQIPGGLLVDCVRAGVLPPRQAIHWSKYQPGGAGTTTLAELIPFLPEGLLDEALVAARAVVDGRYRTETLGVIAGRLAEPERAGILAEALASARAVEDGHHRAWALADLAERLSESERAGVLAEALAVACSIDHHGVRGEALATLAPSLPEALLDGALAAARIVENDTGRARALAALAGHLPGAERAGVLAEALAAARAVADKRHRAEVLAALARTLPAPGGADVLAEALAAARAVADHRGRVRALAALAGRLAESERIRVLAEALDTARSVANGPQRAWALFDLAPVLPKDLVHEALTAARALAHVELRAPVLVALVERLDMPEHAGVLVEALSAARAVADAQSRARALATLAGHLADPERGIVAAEALAAARAIADWRQRAKWLAGLARMLPLPEPERVHVLAEALAAVRAIADGQPRARALAALAGYLPEPERAGVLDRALATARTITDGGSRAEVLVALAADRPGPERIHVFGEVLAAIRAVADDFIRYAMLEKLAPTLPEELVGEALMLARAIGQDRGRITALTARARALAALAGRLPEPERAGVFAEVLTAARTAPQEFVWDRTHALAAVAGGLPEPMRTSVFGEALAAARAVPDGFDGWANHMLADVLSETTAAARTIEQPGSFSSGRPSAVPSLVQVLPAALLTEALAAARAIGHKQHRAQALVAVAGRLPEAEGARVLTEALAAGRAIGHRQNRAQMLATLAESLPESERADVLAEALAAARAIADANYRAQALGELAGRLPAAERADVLTEALAVARVVPDDWSRSEALGALARVLPEGLLGGALAAARVLADDKGRARALAALAERLSEPERAGVLAEALAAARAVADERHRVEVLTAIVERLPEASQRGAVCTFLQDAGRLNRAELLGCLPSFYPVFGRFDGHAGLHEVQRAIHDAGAWFP